MTRWVVGVDGSDHARAALTWAAAQAVRHDATVEAVAAWQYPYVGVLPLAGEALPAVDEESEAAVGNQASEMAAEVAAATGARVVGRAELGTPAHVLLDAAAEADLVAVGSRGRGGFARLLLGSVSHQVATHAERPTVIVPGESRPELETAVVGIDGSDNARAALQWLWDFAPEEAELIALGSWDVGYLGSEHSTATVLTEYKAEAERTFNEALDAFEAENGHAGRITRRFSMGYPGEQLVTAAKDADLLVVGARGHRGLSGAILGSTTTWVIHHLNSPTAVIPAPTD